MRRYQTDENELKSAEERREEPGAPSSSNPGNRTSYLRPLGVDEPRFDGVVQSRAVLAQPQVRGGAVAVQDAVLRVGAEGLRVQTYGQGEVPLLAGLVTAPHTLQKFSLAQGGGTRTRSRDGPRPHRRWRLQRTGRGCRRGVDGSVRGAGSKKRELRKKRREP